MGEVIDIIRLQLDKQRADILGMTPAQYRRLRHQGNPDVKKLEDLLTYRIDEGRY